MSLLTIHEHNISLCYEIADLWNTLDNYRSQNHSAKLQEQNQKLQKLYDGYKKLNLIDESQELVPLLQTEFKKELLSLMPSLLANANNRDVAEPLINKILDLLQRRWYTMQANEELWWSEYQELEKQINAIQATRSSWLIEDLQKAPDRASIESKISDMILLNIEIEKKLKLLIENASEKQFIITSRENIYDIAAKVFIL